MFIIICKINLIFSTKYQQKIWRYYWRAVISISQNHRTMLATVDEQIIRLAVACRVKNHLSFSRKIKPLPNLYSSHNQNNNLNNTPHLLCNTQNNQVPKTHRIDYFFAYFISLFLCIKQNSFWSIRCVMDKTTHTNYKP